MRLPARGLFTISYYLYYFYYLYYLAPTSRCLRWRVTARGLRFKNCVRLAMAFGDLHCTPCRDDGRQRDEHECRHVRDHFVEHCVVRRWPQRVGHGGQQCQDGDRPVHGGVRTAHSDRREAEQHRVDFL